MRSASITRVAERRTTGAARCGAWWCRWKILVFAGWMVGVVSCGDPAAVSEPGFDPLVLPDGDPLGTVTSADGAWSVSFWTAPSPPRKGSVQVLYRVVDGAAAPADLLALQVVPWMPAHGHGGATAAPVAPWGEGWYLIAPVYLYMSGRWELRTTIAPATTDGTQTVDNKMVVPVLDVP